MRFSFAFAGGSGRFLLTLPIKSEGRTEGAFLRCAGAASRLQCSFSPAELRRQRRFRLSARLASLPDYSGWRKAVEPFPSFSRTVGSSFRRLEPVERQFLQTAIQANVPIVKTILKPEAWFCLSNRAHRSPGCFPRKTSRRRNPEIPSSNAFFVRRLAT